jgi:hypothetical protein
MKFDVRIVDKDRNTVLLESTIGISNDNSRVTITGMVEHDNRTLDVLLALLEHMKKQIENAKAGL